MPIPALPRLTAFALRRPRITPPASRQRDDTLTVALRKRLTTAHGPTDLDLAFSLRRGDSVAVLGPSGAGKTTLLRLLFMSLKPTRGLITIFGKDRARI